MITEDTRVPLYPFDRWNYTPVLPLVYNDALSYIETLGQFADKLNEVIDAINNITTEAVELAKHYTDAQIRGVKEDLQVTLDEYSRTLDEYSNRITEIREEVETFKVIVNTELAGMQAQIDRFLQLINDESVLQRQYTDLAISQNNETIMEEVSKGLINLKVLNYFTGELVTVQQMFDYLANLHATDGITVAELIERDKTVDELIALNIDVTDLVLHGKTIII